MTGQDDAERREEERLAELDRFQVLDSAPEAAFEELVAAAAAIARTPAAAVSLVDEHRQWFKAYQGLSGPGTPRSAAFCDLVVQDDAEVIIDDTLLESRLADNPDVGGGAQFRFYAGFPLRTPSGAVLGTLCVIDHEPRTLTPDQLAILRTLAEQVMAQLRLRRELRERGDLIAAREAVHRRLEDSEKRYRFLVENSSDVIAQHRPDGSVSYVSPAVQGLLGVTPHSPDDWNLADRIHPDDVQGYTESYLQAMSGQATTATGRIRHADGEYRYLETTLNPVLGEDGSVIEILATTRDATQRHRAQETLNRTREDLLQQRELLELAQELAEIGSWATDLRTQVVVWSREAHRLMGTDPQMPLDTETIWDYIHPEDHDQVAGAVGIAFDLGRSDDVEFRVRRADGELRIVRSRYRVERDESGTPLRLSGTMLDITRSRQAEVALSRANAEVATRSEQLEEAQEIAAVGSWSLDRVTGISVWSKELYRILGVSPETLEATPDSFLAHLHPQDRGWFGQVIDDALRSGTAWSHEHRIVVASGEIKEVLNRGRVDLDTGGEVIRIGGIVQDVTRIRRARRELLAARDQFMQLLSAATDQAIIGTDPSGLITLFNKGAERMTGYTPEEAFGHNPMELLHDPDAAGQQISGSAEGPPESGLEWIWVRKDGQKLNVQISLTPMTDHDGAISGYLGIATDVTQQRAAERERDRAEADVQAAMIAISDARDQALAANHAKSAFLATMSHEIRTPMNAVIGMTGLLLDTRLDDEQRDLVETVRGSGDQLLAIINDILDFSKIEAGDLDLEHRAFDLRDLVEDTVAQFAGSANGVDLLTLIEDTCPVNVIGDSTRLRQVLSNLISNAIKFTSAGDVLVHVTLVEQEQQDQISLLFKVRDSGIGIPAMSLHRLFKSFSQVDASTTRVYGGTGLGLAISKALVTAMGGDIWVESTLGEGSTFSFSVQLGRDDERPSTKPGAMGAEDLRSALCGRRVLIVDDNATNRRILRLQLASHGATSVDVPGSVEALRLLIDEAQTFDLAVLDLIMPVLDGVQLAGAIRRGPGLAELPIVLLSNLGRRLKPHEEQLFAAILTKPARSGPLMEAFARAIAPVAASSGSLGWTALQQVSHPGGVPAQGRSQEPAHPEQRLLRILMAEDNEVNQKVGRLMLAKLGHQAEIVGNGQQALDAALGCDYDVILMDIHMPVMDGLEATRRIRAELGAQEERRQPVIIAMTASVTLADREACAEAGMNDYLSKPVRSQALSSLLAGVGEAGHVRN